MIMMIVEVLLVAVLAVTVMNVVLLASIPDIVRRTIQRELERLFEGEYQ